MKTAQNAFTATLSALGVSISLLNIEHLLNIVLLVVSILNICVLFLVRVLDKLKDKKLTKEEVKEIVRDAYDTSQEIKNIVRK